MEHYNDKRIKAKLKGLTPAQCRSQSFSTNIKNILSHYIPYNLQQPSIYYLFFLSI
ncbi:MAG: IS3 family transposase [Fusobacterium varium]|uniref:IS3 family transposase n=1 Tax=Fusobacterium varium TaxID=856 RepID=UPI00399102D3